MKMKFTTSVPVKEQEPKIDHNSKVLLLGSCFVENIGEKLDYYQFQNLRNPFGIFYHPGAIETFIRKVTENYTYEEKDIFFHNEQWHCFDAHSCLNSSSKEELLTKLNQGIADTRQFIKNSSHIVLTFGTSWYYNELKTGLSVANCHKIDQKEFEKKIFSVQENEKVINKVIQCLLTLNSTLKLIFTVSPVRHMKDGFVENQRSKAHLLAAIHQVISSQYREYPNTCFYFPAYEIMLDELRDYRFYAEDMLHPNSLAVDFIWSKFTISWVSKDAAELFKSIETIHRGLGHKPFNENSEKHQVFLKMLKEKIKILGNKIPTNNFKKVSL